MTGNSSTFEKYSRETTFNKVSLPNVFCILSTFSRRENSKISSIFVSSRKILRDSRFEKLVRVESSFPLETKILGAQKKEKYLFVDPSNCSALRQISFRFPRNVFSVESLAKRHSYGSSKLTTMGFAFGADLPAAVHPLISTIHPFVIESIRHSTFLNLENVLNIPNAFLPFEEFVFQYLYFSKQKTTAEPRDASSYLMAEWWGVSRYPPPVFLWWHARARLHSRHVVNASEAILRTRHPSIFIFGGEDTVYQPV